MMLDHLIVGGALDHKDLEPRSEAENWSYCGSAAMETYAVWIASE